MQATLLVELLTDHLTHCVVRESATTPHPESKDKNAEQLIAGEVTARAEAAKAICATCPVIKECREQSLKVREPYGVWGGLSEDERRALKRRTARARARVV